MRVDRATAARDQDAAPATAHAISAGRRSLLRGAGLVAALAACGLLDAPLARAAAEDAAFAARTLREVLEGLGGQPASATQIVLTLEDVVENGALVPVSVECTLPGVGDIFLVVEANPTPLAVRFRIPEGTEPYISTRLKLAQSGRVHAIARAQGVLYATSRDTRVTVSGCG
jgi:sulfur-oxidizing protein SoxY